MMIRWLRNDPNSVVAVAVVLAIVAVVVALAGCSAGRTEAPSPVGRCAAAFRVMEHRGIAQMRPARIRAHGDDQDVAALNRAQAACRGLSAAQARRAASAAAS